MESEFEEQVEITAPTVDEAIILGLTRLSITREEALIEVLDEGSKGFLGLGSREAHVRVMRRALPAVESPEVLPPAPVVHEPARVAEELPQAHPVSNVPQKPKAEPPVSQKVVAAPAAFVDEEDEEEYEEEVGADQAQEGDLDRDLVEQVARDVAQHLFGDLQVSINLTWRQADRPTLWLSVRGKDADSLVGARAQTLEATQYLVRALVRRRVDGRFNLVVDADGYRGRRQKSLENLARKMADRAVDSGHPVRLHPMPASERRVIHMSLRKDSRVRTESVGSGQGRAVTVIPVK